MTPPALRLRGAHSPQARAPHGEGSLVDDYSAAPDRVARLARVVLVGVLLLAVVGIRWKAFSFQSGDYTYFLKPWYDHLDQLGFGAFKHSFASYNMPYLYLVWFGSVLGLGALATVKAIAFGFDLLLAVGVFRLVRVFAPRQLAWAAGLGVLLLPSVWMNSALWGQVDAMYTCFVLFSLEAVLRRRQRWAWFWFGVAFAMKLQAIFFLPWLVLAWALNRRRDWLAPLLVLVAPLLALVPAACEGMPVKDLVGVYYGQATSSDFFARAPGFWRLVVGVHHKPDVFARPAVMLTAALLVGFLALLVSRHGWHLDARRMVCSAAAVSLLIPFFLPNMRNRYDYIAEILVFVLAFVQPGRWWLCLLLEFAITPTYPRELLYVPVPLGEPVWVFVVGLVLAVLVRDSLSQPTVAPAGGAPAPAAPAAPADPGPARRPD